MNKMRLMHKAILFYIIVALSSCTLPTVKKESAPSMALETQTETANLSERELAVIRAMLDHETQGNDRSKQVIVLSAWSSAGMLLTGSPEENATEKISVHAIRSFLQMNSRKYLWPKDLDSRHDIHFLTSSESKEIWSDNRGWDRFNRLYPTARGITTISRVGFSANGRLALVYRSGQTDWLGGHDMIYVLRHEQGKWRITKEQVGGIRMS
jgi:hypothetical protein